MHNNFITEAKRKDLNTTIILYGSNCNIRMTSFPPKPLLNINKKKLIDFQLSIINNSFIKNEIILCGGFKFDSLVNGNYKLIENQLFDKNNECDDIRLAANIAKYKNILLIDQSTFFNKNTLKSIYDNSFIICSEDKNDYVGVNHENDLLTSLYYNDNKLKWKNISFIHEKNFKDFKKLLDSKNYTNKFLFELLNDMAGSNKINIFKKDNITTIYSPKELRELNENFNT